MNVTNSSNFIIRTDLTNAYFKDIRNAKVMTKQEEIELFKKFEESVERLESVKASKDMFSSADYANIVEREMNTQTEIRNEIILRNQRFNFAVAKRYDNNSILMDLVNVGTIGMYEAFEKFNYKEGNRFCSFAVWYIRRAINAYLVKENLTVRTTNNTRYLPKVKKIENEFFLKNGRKPTYTEITDLLFEKYGIEGVSLSDLCAVRVDSIDATYGEDEDFTYEKCSEYAVATASQNDYETSIENESVSEATRKALSVLNERERTIICMAAGYGYSKEYKDKEIGDALGLTSERVRQLRHSAAKKFAEVYKAA
jgi:RNA polymerase primary sigma factor